MSFLDDLLTDSLIAGAASSRGRLLKLIIGLLGVTLAGGMLLYYLSWEPTTAAAYHVESIVYTRSYYDEKSEGGKIVLESGGKEYKLFPYLWQGQYDADAVVRELSKHSEAKVWLPSAGDVVIKGIVTPALTIDPAVGESWDRSNRKAMFWVLVSFFAGGAVLIVMAILY